MTATTQLSVLDSLRNLGACSEAIKWIEANPGKTPQELYRDRCAAIVGEPMCRHDLPAATCGYCKGTE